MSGTADDNPHNEPASPNPPHYPVPSPTIHPDEEAEPR